MLKPLQNKQNIRSSLFFKENISLTQSNVLVLGGVKSGKHDKLPLVEQNCSIHNSSLIRQTYAHSHIFHENEHAYQQIG